MMTDAPKESMTKSTPTPRPEASTSLAEAGARRRRRRPLFALALAAALAGTFAVAKPASACGMRSFYYQAPPSPEKLLARAARELRLGHPGTAAMHARQVIASGTARAAQRAAAYTVLAWTQLRRGDKDGALASLAQGQALSPGAVSIVLAVAPVDPTMQALRAAKKV
jgi:hypothetical protein